MAEANKKLDLATEAYRQISLHPGASAELRLPALAAGQPPWAAICAPP